MRKQKMSAWTEWDDIGKDPRHKGSGVYKVRLVGSKGNSVVIPRFIHKDNEGILQIGHSEDINRRIRYFCGAYIGNKYAHAEGIRMHNVVKYTDIGKIHKDFTLQYSFWPTPNIIGAKMEEERLLKCYFLRHGEVPPLNNNLPDKYINWENLECE